MLIIADVTCLPGGHRELRNEVGSLGPAKHLVGFEPFDSYHNALTHQNTLHNKFRKSFESVIHSIYRGIAKQFKNIFVVLGLRLKLLSSVSLEVTRCVLVKLVGSISLASVVTSFKSKYHFHEVVATTWWLYGDRCGSGWPWSLLKISSIQSFHHVATYR